jgi:Ca2+-binding RTX toxin-like protein
VQSNQTVWDHVWHTIRCERQSNGVTLTIDGGPPKTIRRATGNISNNKLLSIGGKAYCDAVTVQCDYYVGLLDRIAVMRPQCHGVAATMTGGSGADELIGTPGRDVIVAGGGADQIWGRGGDDLICAGSGTDQVQGGAGRDRIYGQSGGDHLQGGRNDDRLMAQGGNDELDGNRGDDVLRGGSGFDSGRGGLGSDVCFSVEVARSC